MTQYYIGLMSGTSLDAIDTVLVDLASKIPKTIATHSEPIPPSLKKSLEHLILPSNNEINLMGKADRALGLTLATAVKNLLHKSNVNADKILGIGSHGQNIRHNPYAEFAYSIQIGDPNTIAAETQITTVADFRRRDIALGGQGAPLAPGFHSQFFGDIDRNRIVLNIGGIANITVLPKRKLKDVSGFDTGPGNTLMDKWYQKHNDGDYDNNGAWAATGRINAKLLHKLLEDPYFKKLPPKSTGREYFNLHWLDTAINAINEKVSAEDVQATLLELSAITIANGINQSLNKIDEVIVCGGGVHNRLLIETIVSHSNCKLVSSIEYGVDPDYVEAIGFAWLAQRTLTGKTSNLPKVTGAKKESILGAIYKA